VAQYFGSLSSRSPRRLLVLSQLAHDIFRRHAGAHRGHAAAADGASQAPPQPNPTLEKIGSVTSIQQGVSSINAATKHSSGGGGEGRKGLAAANGRQVRQSLVKVVYDPRIYQLWK
jgi:hypothetical protein